MPRALTVREKRMLRFGAAVVVAYVVFVYASKGWRWLEQKRVVDRDAKALGGLNRDHAVGLEKMDRDLVRKPGPAARGRHGKHHGQTELNAEGLKHIGFGHGLLGRQDLADAAALAFLNPEGPVKGIPGQAAR